MELLHRWAAVIWPQDAAAALILLAACAVLAIGLWRRRRGFGRFVPSLLLVAVCELWVLIADLSRRPLFAWWPLGAVACVLLAIHLAAGREARLAPEAASGRATGRGYLVVGGLLTCSLLGFRLASSPGQLLIWEPPVIEGFGGALREGHGAVDFLRATLLWDEGLVSRGDHSLIYGAPTYALLLHAGFGVAQLRIVAALLAAAAVVVAFLLARRFGGGVATAAALALALSPPLLFYGRYGTSLSGTLLGVLLATWACWGLLAAPARQWWRGLVAALALIVATLGYSPGRLVVLALLAVTVAFTAARLRSEGRRLVGLVLLAAALAGFWAYQARSGADWSFLNARGEQIVNMMRQPGYLQSFLHRPASDEPRTRATWIDVAGTLVAQRAPEYLSVLIAPYGRQVHFDKVVFFDPPRLPLFIAPLLPFVLLGLAASLRGVRRPEHSTLLGWLLLTTLPLLLTTRVDAHRMVLLVVPFALWTAFGVVEAVAALDEAQVGRRPRQVVCVVLIGLLAWLNVVAIFPVDPQSPVQSPAMIAELAGLRGEVVLASIANQRDIGLVDLALLERQRRDPGSRGRRLADEKVRELVDGAAVDPVRISKLVAEVGTGTLLMVPAEAFMGTAAVLRNAGLEVVELGPHGARFWRISRPVAAPGA